MAIVPVVGSCYFNISHSKALFVYEEEATGSKHAGNLPQDLKPRPGKGELEGEVGGRQINKP